MVGQGRLFALISSLFFVTLVFARRGKGAVAMDFLPPYPVVFGGRA